jgi:hypothetical protein
METVFHTAAKPTTGKCRLREGHGMEMLIPLLSPGRAKMALLNPGRTRLLGPSSAGGHRFCLYFTRFTLEYTCFPGDSDGGGLGLQNRRSAAELNWPL